MRGFPKGSRGNLKSFVIASLPKGSPTPSVIASPPPAGVAISRRDCFATTRNDSERDCHCEASQRAVLHPLSLRARLRRAWQSQDEIASLPLAMTVREIVIARLPKGQSYTLCHCEPASGGRGNLKTRLLRYHSQ